MISLRIYGTPSPKGSNRAMVRGGRAVFVPGGSKPNQIALKSWDAAVRDVARARVGGRSEPVYVGRPIAMAIQFLLDRPAGHWSKRGGLLPSAPIWPAVKPDVDKLARATCDALSGLVFDDDARIVSMLAGKCYAAPGMAGAQVLVWDAVTERQSQTFSTCDSVASGEV